MKKKIVITGANGFIGANLTRQLIKKNYEVHIITRKNPSLWRLESVVKKIIIHEGMLAHKETLARVIKKISPAAIFHLAAYGSYPSQQDSNIMVQTNITNTMNLLESIKTSDTQCIIAGTSSEYGKKEKPMKESDFLEPNNNYAATKAAQTHLAQVFAKTFHKQILIFRLFNVYGYYEEKGRLVRSVIEWALQNQPIKLVTGKEARDFIFVDDVVDAFLHATQFKRYTGEIFNIGTGKQTTLLQLAKKVTRIINKQVPIALNAYPGRPWDSFHWKADMRKTKTELQWKSKTTLDDGLQKTIAWYKTYEKNLH